MKLYNINFLLIYLLFLLINVSKAIHARRKSSILMERLCSKNLSDTLDIICSGKGFNSQGIMDFMVSKHGIVEECCHKQCTYEQLEQYCEYSSDEFMDDTEAYSIIIRK